MKVPPMHVAYAAGLLLLFTAACASVTPDTSVSQPQVIAPQPDTPQPAAKPVAPATPQPALAPVPAPDAVSAPRVTTPAPQAASEVVPPVARTSAPIGRGPKPAASPVAAPPAPVAPLTLDLNALKERLKQTKAIGIFTKIALKNQVDDLLEQFSEYYEGKAKLTMTDLRRSYNLLMMKVLSLLQDADQTLASAIVSSREAIWGLLADPKTFATLQS
ncbi:MAG: hypothetical protein ABW318_10750 [Vicinamibacterales bacterium]